MSNGMHLLKVRETNLPSCIKAIAGEIPTKCNDMNRQLFEESIGDFPSVDTFESRGYISLLFV